MQIYISKNNQQLGPLDEAKVLEMLANGQLSANDLGIRQGENQWQSLKAIFPNITAVKVLNANDASAEVNPPKSRKGFMFGCLGLLFIGGVIASILLYFAYQRMNPTPTASEVPETIGKFKKEKLESSSGNLMGGKKGFVAIYVSNENGKEVKLKYYFHSFNNEVLPMLWDDLKCSGKYENENRVVYLSRQIGKTAYCNSDTPFYQISFDKYAITLAPESKDVSSKTLEEMALSLVPQKNLTLVPFNP